ncbi:MAG: methyl-accepting chemotaxis protein [Lachnospiraceae bacterium]|nr:methyl-accepting chemotaxis protein [Lachnospiraceae bacterium]
MKGTIKRFNINNVKIGVKIMVLVILGIIGMMIIGTSGYRALSKASKDIDTMYNNRLQAIQLMSEEINYTRKLQSRILENITDPSDKEVISDIDKLIASYEETWPQYAALVNGVPELAEIANKTETDWKAYTDMASEIKTMVAAGKTAEALEKYKSYKPTVIHALIVDLEGLQEKAKDSASVLNQEIQKTNHDESIFILTCIITCLAGLALISYLIVRAITSSLKEMVNDVEEMKNGDFRIKGEKVDRRDEFGVVSNAIYDMRSSLNALMSEVHASAEQLAASSEELSASSEQSAQASSVVAESAQDVIGTVDKQNNAVNSSTESVKIVLSSVDSIRQQSEQVAKESIAAAEEVQKGNVEVEKSVAQIKHIEEIVEQTAKLVNKLGERSTEIGKIVDTITSISDETNLLALNAAIEASHAGDYGKGFNVVATEVRNLANKSAESAKQIEKLIYEIQKDTQSAVSSMNEGKEAVIKGSSDVQNLTVVFGKINDLVTDVSSQIAEVSGSVEEMADGMGQIGQEVINIQQHSVSVSNEMQNVSAATQQQSASAQELAAASESLASLATDQQSALAAFQF